MNDAGDMVGSFISGQEEFGYFLKNRTFRKISIAHSTDTVAEGVNNADFVVGVYTDAVGVAHGFVVVP